jgi:broad specificity phosphatase PhoE
VSDIIALVRHGETEWNRQRRWQGRGGVELNDLGRRQAAAAVPLLRDRSWSWMISSPLERARQTAEIIAEGLAMQIDTDDELVERDYGEADGVFADEANRRWPDGSYPGMEEDDQLARRGATALRRIAAAHSGDGIVVAHGSLIRFTIGELCGIDAPRIMNGAVSLLSVQDGDWQPVELNRLGEVAAAGYPTTGV